MSELEKLKAQNAELNDRISKLEEAAKPPKPFEPLVWQKPDPTEGMSMDRETMQAMVKASSSYMADLRADARKPNPIRASQAPLTTSSPSQSQPQQRGTGWAPEVPLGPPPGIAHADRLMDTQDKIDRAELALKLAKLGKAE
jgi:hypothetical protein